MDINQLFADIQELNNLIYKINKREPSAISELNRLNRILFGEVVTAGCSNCHIKAFRKLTSLTISDLKAMENQKFKIKKDVLVEYPFRSGQFFSSALGVSNELAIEYLTNHPDKLSQFEVYPGSESESKELDKMNKTELQAKYKSIIGSDPDDSLTKKELIEAIKEADKQD